MNAVEKLARQRRSVLELAEAPGNVGDACHRRGMTRTQFYAYKRRFHTHGPRRVIPGGLPHDLLRVGGDAPS